MADSGQGYTQDDRDADAQDLHGLGYAQELLREMGGFPNFAISFSIISIFTGAVALYGHGLTAGGPYVMTVGWPLVTIFVLLVAASMAEIASAIPTAGAMYHWASFLGGRGWGWCAGWFNLVGQYSITAGIDFACAEFLTPLVGLDGQNRVHVLGVFAAILVSHGALNHYRVRLVAFLNSLSAWYHMVGVVIFVAALFLFAEQQPLGFLFETGFATQAFKDSTLVPDGPWLWFFLLGLLQAQWTYTGYDASAHISEETQLPRVNAPWGIFLSVGVSAVFGYVMLIAVTLSIKDLPAAANASDVPVFMHVIIEALGQRGGVIMMWVVTIAMWFCGLSSLTANARMIYAFARDGGMPLGRLWSKVHPRWRTPTTATWQAVVIAFLLALYSDAFSVIVSISVISLYVAYAIPIALRLRSKFSGQWRAEYDGPWSLGRWSTPVAIVAMAWITFITVLFVAPPNQQTGYTMAGLVVFLGVYWFGFGERKRFKGPRALGTEEELYTDAPTETLSGTEEPSDAIPAIESSQDTEPSPMPDEVDTR